MKLGYARASADENNLPVQIDALAEEIRRLAVPA